MEKILKNDQLSISIESFGAEMHSIQHDGIEYLWQADPKFWARHAPVLFPIVGKLKDGQYQHEDQTFKMGGHGFARDSEFKLIESTEDKAVYELVSTDKTYEVYPFHFKFRVSYTLVGNKITVGYHVISTDDETMYFGVGAHPAFNVPLEHGDFENYALTISPRAERSFIPLDPPTGVLKVSDSFKVEDYKKKLTRELFKNDALVYSSETEKMEVSLTNDLDDRSVKVSWENMPYFGLWSPYPAEAKFVCIEPWAGLADDQDTSGDLFEKFAINKLAAGKEFACEYTIEIN